MTQVVNGYLAWRFDDFDVRVIRSRDGSRGARSLLIFGMAVAKVLALRGRDHSVVVVHLSQGGSFVREGLLMRLARWRGFGTVAQIHGSSFAEFAARRPGLVAKVLASASRILVLSDESMAVASSVVDPGRVLQLPNAVPDGSPAGKQKLIVFGGAVTRRKGVDVLVEAWRRVGSGSGWTLMVAGPVIDEEVVPGVLDDATFLGGVDHSELMALLDRSAIAVLPSRDEAMPMFILEAMARDNCIIATPVGGIPDVLGSGEGILVEPGSVEALADALQLAMTNEAARLSTAASARASFDSRYSSSVVYPRVAALWSDAITTR
jgi:glycosyltransferase involved in cell wall biosynthesis